MNKNTKSWEIWPSKCIFECYVEYTAEGNTALNFKLSWDAVTLVLRVCVSIPVCIMYVCVVLLKL